MTDMRHSLPRIATIWAATLVLVGLATLALFADQGLSGPLSSSPRQPANSSPATSTPMLLPVIPSKTAMPFSGFVGHFQNDPLPNPDDVKNLYGYEGPYYNITDLDDQVVVLDQSLYVWNTANWKVSGMFRNQTRNSIVVTAVEANLLNAQGGILATATATVPVAALRPGEPGPFVIDSTLLATAAKSVVWHIAYHQSTETPRMYEFGVDSEQVTATNGYYLIGRITNDNGTTVPTRVVAAWLDYEGNGRVLYVASPQIVLVRTGKAAVYNDSFEMPAGDVETIVYRNHDAQTAQLLKNSRLVLWGTSQ